MFSIGIVIADPSSNAPCYPPTVRSFSPSSHARLTRHDLGRFPGDTLFDRLGRAVCEAGCLPRKELYEAWEVARRARRLFRGGRVVDLAAGHGLLVQVMLLLDDSSPDAVAVDSTFPPSCEKVHEALLRVWPRLAGRVAFVHADIGAFALYAGDVVVSGHACGHLTDVVLERAAAAGARVAVMPCCHHLVPNERADLCGWVDRALAVDVERACRLRARGYRISTQTIPASITPKNRLLLGEPFQLRGIAGGFHGLEPGDVRRVDGAEDGTDDGL